MWCEAWNRRTRLTAAETATIPKRGTMFAVSLSSTVLLNWYWRRSLSLSELQPANSCKKSLGITWKCFRASFYLPSVHLANIVSAGSYPQIVYKYSFQIKKKQNFPSFTSYCDEANIHLKNIDLITTISPSGGFQRLVITFTSRWVK